MDSSSVRGQALDETDPGDTLGPHAREEGGDPGPHGVAEQHDLPVGEGLKHGRRVRDSVDEVVAAADGLVRGAAVAREIDGDELRAFEPGGEGREGGGVVEPAVEREDHGSSPVGMPSQPGDPMTGDLDLEGSRLVHRPTVHPRARERKSRQSRHGKDPPSRSSKGPS